MESDSKSVSGFFSALQVSLGASQERFLFFLFNDLLRLQSLSLKPVLPREHTCSTRARLCSVEGLFFVVIVFLVSKFITKHCCLETAAIVDYAAWLWLKKPVPKWNPGKWKHGPKPA